MTLRLAAALLLAVPAAVCPVRGAGGATAEPPTVRFGYQQTVWGAPAMYAVHEDVFAGTGIRVEGVKFAAGKDARDALIGGSVDIVSVGATPFLVGAAKADLVAIAMSAYAGRTLAVVARAGAGIATVGALRGKTIASQVGTSTDYVFHSVVAPASGLGPGDYRTVNLAFQNHVSALASGSVDAFAGVEPYPSLAVDGGLGVKLLDFGGYDMAPLVLAARASFVRDHPERVLAFLSGWSRVVAAFRDSPGIPVSIVKGIFEGAGYDIPEAVLKRCLESLEVTTEYRPGLRAYFLEQATVLKSEGKIDAIPDWERVLDVELKRRAGLP